MSVSDRSRNQSDQIASRPDRFGERQRIFTISISATEGDPYTWTGMAEETGSNVTASFTSAGELIEFLESRVPSHAPVGDSAQTEDSETTVSPDPTFQAPQHTEESDFVERYQSGAVGGPAGLTPGPVYTDIDRPGVGDVPTNAAQHAEDAHQGIELQRDVHQHLDALGFAGRDKSEDEFGT